MPLPYAPAFSLIPPPGTRILLGLIAACTVAGLLVPSAVFFDWMTTDPGTLPELRLTGLWISRLLSAPGSGLGLLIFLVLLGWIYQAPLRRLWHRKPLPLVVGGAVAVAVGVTLNDLMHGLLFGLVLSTLTVGWGAASAERVWGAKRLLLFTGLVVTAVGVVDGLVAWIWPGSFSGLFGGGTTGLVGSAYGGAATPALDLPKVVGSYAAVGTDPLFHGFMAVFAAIVGRRRLAPIPFEGRHLIWLFVALDLIDLFFVSFRQGLAGLVAITAARALMDGTWRPQSWIDRLRMWRLARRRGKLRVVQGGGRTLH